MHHVPRRIDPGDLVGEELQREEHGGDPEDQRVGEDGQPLPAGRQPDPAEVDGQADEERRPVETQPRGEAEPEQPSRGARAYPAVASDSPAAGAQATGEGSGCRTRAVGAGAGGRRPSSRPARCPTRHRCQPGPLGGSRTMWSVPRIAAPHSGAADCWEWAGDGRSWSPLSSPVPADCGPARAKRPPSDSLARRSPCGRGPVFAWRHRRRLPDGRRARAQVPGWQRPCTRKST